MVLSTLLSKLKYKIDSGREGWGYSSVSLLLKDRPEIAELLNDQDALKQWLVEQFSGKVTKFPIQWDPKEPEDSDFAEHCHPRRKEYAKIRVRRNMTGLDQLSGLVFELFNIQNHKRQSRLWEKTCKGKTGRQEYSRRAYRLEYKSMKKCKRFFKKNSSVFFAAEDSNEVYNPIMSLTSFREYYASILARCGGETYFMKASDRGKQEYQNKLKGR